MPLIHLPDSSYCKSEYLQNAEQNKQVLFALLIRRGYNALPKKKCTFAWPCFPVFEVDISTTLHGFPLMTTKPPLRRDEHCIGNVSEAPDALLSNVWSSWSSWLSAIFSEFTTHSTDKNDDSSLLLNISIGQMTLLGRIISQSSSATRIIAIIPYWKFWNLFNQLNQAIHTTDKIPDSSVLLNISINYNYKLIKL